MVDTVVVDQGLLAERVRSGTAVVRDAVSEIRTRIVLRSQYPGSVSGALAKAAATVFADTPYKDEGGGGGGKIKVQGDQPPPKKTRC